MWRKKEQGQVHKTWEALKVGGIKFKYEQFMGEETNYLDVVNFTNIDRADFDGMWGGERTTIKAGETRQFPRFLANHYAKHLIDKILIRGGQDFSNELLRAPLADQILGSIARPPAESTTGLPSVGEPTSSAPVPEFEEKPKEEPKVEVPPPNPKKKGRPKKI